MWDNWKEILNNIKPTSDDLTLIIFVRVLMIFVRVLIIFVRVLMVLSCRAFRVRLLLSPTESWCFEPDLAEWQVLMIRISWWERNVGWREKRKRKKKKEKKGFSFASSTLRWSNFVIPPFRHILICVEVTSLSFLLSNISWYVFCSCHVLKIDSFKNQ